MLFSRVILTAAWACLVLLTLSAPARAADRPISSADDLLARGKQRFAKADLESRIAALRDFTAALDLAPQRYDIWFACGRARRECGDRAQARSCFERAASLRPADPSTWCELGAEWKEDWLLSTERSSLDEALKCFAQATELAPDSAGPWCAASALLLLEGRPKDALRAALRARRADLGGIEPLLVLGASSYRLGELAYADTAFRLARDGMNADLRKHFDGDAGLVTVPGASDTSANRVAGESRWRDVDPDLTTPENEALLDYRTRVSLAFFLFRDRGVLYWDARADLFVRYGPPTGILFNPARAQTGFYNNSELTYKEPKIIGYAVGPFVYQEYGPGPNGYPYNMQLWTYAKLGIRAVMVDLGLRHEYELRPSLDQDRDDPRPESDSLMNHPELAEVGDGRGVFRALAPGAQPMKVAGEVSRFLVGDSTIILAHVSAAGGPADSMVGSWAVVADDGSVLKRESSLLAISACDPAAQKVATFAATVPPGGFRIDLAVAARGGRRGVVHLRPRVDPVPAGLAMSDLVLVCGDPSMSAGPGGVRIEPNLSHQLSDANVVTAYYELDHLVAAPNGETRFSFHDTIRAVAERRNAEPGPVLIESSREENSAGSHRRQFVTAATGSLRAGRYELRVEVRDLIGGGTASGTTEFVKVGS